MDFDILTQSFTEICGHSLIAPSRPLDCSVILNPAAGGFSIRSKWKSVAKILNDYRQKALVNPQRMMFKSIEFINTVSQGSAGAITKAIIKEAEKHGEPFYLIISAGGDGTHSEVMCALYNASAHIRKNIAVLRLPFGTGNDGADGANLAEVLDLLINPVHVEFAPAVQLVTSRSGQAIQKGPFLAFNILSVGLDAYVTHMTNKLKGRLPGDSYKLWLDIAALFYDKVYKVGYIDVRALDNYNREITSFKEKLLFLAMGASGRRTYGSGQLILPDERNVCAVKQTPVYRKIKIKGQVKKGLHADNPETILFNAHRVEISAVHPILAQMDGESVLLQPDDFPAALELTAPVIPLLKRS